MLYSTVGILSDTPSNSDAFDIILFIKLQTALPDCVSSYVINLSLNAATSCGLIVYV